MTATNEVKLPELPKGEYRSNGEICPGWSYTFTEDEMKDYGTLCYEAGLAAGRGQAGQQIEYYASLPQAVPFNGVQVCPVRDVECGNNESAWCADCPKSKKPRFVTEGVGNVLCSCAQILDVVKQEWALKNEWTEWDQSVRDGITKELVKLEALKQSLAQPAQEPVYFYRQKDCKDWIETERDPRETFKNSPAFGAFEFRILYAQQPAQEYVKQDRDLLGRLVRDAWIRWAKSQPIQKPSWLVPYSELSEVDKEADRMIGEAMETWIVATMGAQQPAQAAVPAEISDAFIEAVILRICELPDRESPEYMPEGMIVTAKELREAIRSNEEIFCERGEQILVPINAAPDSGDGS